MPDDTRKDLAEALADIELTPEDGTLILEAVLDHGFRILPVWPSEDEADQSRIVDHILDELLEVDSVDDFVKSRVRYVQKIRTLFEQAREEIEPSGADPLRARADAIAQAIKSEDGVEGKVLKLKRLRRQGDFRGGDGPGPGILSLDEIDEFADATADAMIGMLDRGQRRVLWPNHEFHRLTENASGMTPMGGGERQPVLDDIAGGMIDGMVGGAAAGAKVGKWGGLKGLAASAAAGAIAGGVAGGASVAAGRFRRWLRERMN